MLFNEMTLLAYSSFSSFVVISRFHEIGLFLRMGDFLVFIYLGSGVRKKGIFQLKNCRLNSIFSGQVFPFATTHTVRWVFRCARSVLLFILDFIF
jgi:hypothetical protein